jgi:hypothetical protein
MPKGLKSLARLLDKVPFAPVVAALFGLVAAILVVATPGWLFERMVVTSGLPGLVAAAAPPLGDKARIMAAIISMAGVAGMVWLILALPGMVVKARPAQSRGHRIEPHDNGAGEDGLAETPFRRPLFADADLGAPFMSDEAIAHAREELVLETLAPEDVLDDREPEAAESAPPAQEQAQAAQPQPVPGARSASPDTTDRQSIPDLLERLEKALEHRERRTGSIAPILPGDMAALRQALGVSGLRH